MKSRRSTRTETLLHRDVTRARQPSRSAAQRHLLDLQDALNAIHCNQRPHPHSVAWPAGLDRSIVNGLALNMRTRNCLLRAQFMEGRNPLTVRQVLQLPNFGPKSLKDLLFAVENFLNECVRIAAAAELHGTKTLADALSPESMRLADRTGTADASGASKTGHVSRGTPGLVSVTLSRLALTIDAASETERMIIKHRLVRTPPKTLKAIGSQRGVTRERIRQIQVRIEKKVHAALGGEMRIIASVLKERLSRVVTQGEVERRIDALLPSDHEFATKLLRKVLIDEMGFTLNNGVYLDKQAMEELKDIRAAMRRLADDVGLVSEQQLIASLPDEEWRRFWPWVRKRYGLCNLFGLLGIRDSGKARAKAALISLGRPATRKEISRMCGFGVNKAGSHLSVIPSVVKVDKKRWGLKDWVDKEYKGIVGEIIQRIEEDGGATTTERVLTELPDKFGVNSMSVRAYMQTAKFAIRDGWISLANTSAIQLKDLDDVIDGRDHGGAPYWTFTVEDRFFDGYSVTGVPPEFAKALGCKPDEIERVRIENLPQCRELSISWRLASTTGASFGYLAEPLKQLGLEPSQRARVTIKGPCLVDLSPDDDSAKHARDGETDAISKRTMQQRKLLRV